MDNQFFAFQLGHFDCWAINDVDDTNCNCLLIRTGAHNVLIETGHGDAATPPGLLLERLRAVGIAPAEIDVVILSHCDADHVGGTVDAHGTITFPNARHVMSREEWAFWSSDAPRGQPNPLFDEAALHWANTQPRIRLPHLRDHLVLVEPGDEIVPGMQAVAASGHTPGMMGVAITSGAAQLLFIGDVLYDFDLGEQGRFIGNPELHPVIDHDPAQAIRTRDRLLAEAAHTGTLLMAYHTPFPGLGAIVQDGEGWRWMPRPASSM